MSHPTMAELLARARARAAGTPLRVRLVAILLLLALLALAVTGAVAVTLLRGQLVDKVDAQVTSVARGFVPGGDTRGRGERGLLPTTQYAVVVLDSGRQVPVARRLDTRDPGPDVGSLTPEQVEAREGRPFTVPAVRGPGSWRCVALRVTTLNEGDGTLVVAQSLADVDDTVDRMRVVLALVGLVVLLASGLLGWLAVRRAFRPLTEVEGVARTIADGDLSGRVPEHPTSTEVGRLAASLNAMLSQIEHAFAVRSASEERMRRFVSDASHELRTPLATVRGYAELYRQGAVTDPADVAQAMRRIETEATRMAGLVDDLLTLARLDEQRPEQRAPVDLTVLAADAVQDARALAPGRSVTLTGSNGPIEPAVVLGDEPRLRQLVTNLVVNALRHTPDGTPIELLIGTDAGPNPRSALLQVRDHGPGIAPEHARAVFERFFRSDASRQRGQGGGSGLGLAIVAAIVSAHGGQVGVTQTPGGGATFLVRLPLAPASSDAPTPEDVDAPATSATWPATLTGSSQAPTRH
jgi:two-component system OmpR family sensor kinase